MVPHSGAAIPSQQVGRNGQRSWTVVVYHCSPPTVAAIVVLEVFAFCWLRRIGVAWEACNRFKCFPSMLLAHDRSQPLQPDYDRRHLRSSPSTAQLDAYRCVMRCRYAVRYQYATRCPSLESVVQDVPVPTVLGTLRVPLLSFVLTPSYLRS